MQKCVILGTKSYQFENDKKEKVEGAKISYILENKSSKQNENGYLPLQSSVSLKVLQNINVVPGVYEMEYGMVPGKNNKPQLEVTGFKLVNDLNLETLFE